MSKVDPTSVVRSLEPSLTNDITDQYEGLARLFDVDHHRELDTFNTIQSYFGIYYRNRFIGIFPQSVVIAINPEDV